MASLIRLITLIVEIGLIAYVIASWVVPPYNSVRLILGRIFDPILDPIRRIIPPMAGLDFSVFILFIIIGVLQQILISVLP
jgi:YggT family protein